MIFVLQDDRYRREGNDRFDNDRDERLRRGHGRNDRVSEKGDKGQERRRGRSRLFFIYLLSFFMIYICRKQNERNIFLSFISLK